MDKVAQQWLERIESLKVSDDDRENFARWYEVPSNQDAFEHAKREADDLKAMLQTISARPSIADLRQRVLEETAQNKAASEQDQVKRSAVFDFLHVWRRWLVSGGFAVAAAAFFFAVFIPQQRNTHTTEIGEQRVVMLEDGSRVTLDTNTKMRVRFEDTQRNIHLHRGQAYFEVASNSARPFSVISDHGIVTAVGTAFSVFQSSEKLLVTLTEGKVQVATSSVDLPGQSSEADSRRKSIGKIVSLTPGEQLQFDPKKGLKKGKLDDLNRQMSWLTGKLIFKSTELAEVVDILNRYSEKTVRVVGDELLKTEVDAIFATDDIDTSILALRTMFDLDAFYDEDGNIELRTKKQ